MSDNTALVFMLCAAIGGCSACSISNDISSARKAQIESSERLEVLKATGQPQPKP